MNPEATPSLFDKRLARRLDGLLTLTGALLLLGIELVALGSGERVRGLLIIELFSLSLLAFAGFLRFARTPWLAVLAAMLVTGIYHLLREPLELGGLMRSLRDELADTSVADAFAEDTRTRRPGPG